MRWPVEAVTYRTAPDVQVLVHAQKPLGEAKGQLVMVHGLEGSSEAGYARSLTYKALEMGYATHRFNMRGCGGTDHMSVTAYHAGQTSDVLEVLRRLKEVSDAPLYLVGFSLGANVALKLAGELDGEGLLAGVCSVSAPIDLAACARALQEPQNFLYQQRFVSRLKERIKRRHGQAPEVYTLVHLPKIRTILDFDEYYTSKLFGFGTAANYFRTQSANQFLERIRVRTLLIQAQDDPLIPFSAYDLRVFKTNPKLELVTPRHGGHLGFLSRQRPRFWVDEVIVGWIRGN